MKRSAAKRLLNRIVTAVLAVAMCVTAFPAASKTVQAAVIPSNVSKPSSGCVFIAMDGEYVSGAAAAVKRINEIRYEACKKGYKLNGRKLSLKDYVPIKWSAGLEKIARIRAAESSVTIGHSRLNDKSVFDFSYPGSGWARAELIAWNWTDSMAMAVEQWYEEKADYISGKANAVTGHYTAMINPDNRYVGIGAFVSKTAKYSNTTVAQFMGAGSQTEKIAKATGKCSAKIEVSKSKITSVKISGGKAIDRAQNASLSLRAVLGGYGTTSYKVLSDVKWSSSNTSVATVSSTGVVTGLKKGTAKITAKVGSKSASYTITVSGNCVHSYTSKVVKAASSGSAGKLLYTCKVCGHKKSTEIKAIKSVSLSYTSCKYTGKAKTPSVVVKDTAGTAIPAKYYTVTYPKNRANAGTYSVTITFNGKYSGKAVRKFKIVK